MSRFLNVLSVLNLIAALVLAGSAFLGVDVVGISPLVLRELQGTAAPGAVPPSASAPAPAGPTPSAQPGEAGPGKPREEGQAYQQQVQGLQNSLEKLSAEISRMRSDQKREDEARAKALREQQAREDELRVKMLQEQQAREAELRDKLLREQQAREDALRDKLLKEQQAREEELRAQMLREQQARQEAEQARLAAEHAKQEERAKLAEAAKAAQSGPAPAAPAPLASVPSVAPSALPLTAVSPPPAPIAAAKAVEIVHVLGEATFPPGGFQLAPSVADEVARIAAEVRGLPGATVVVEGHTDAYPVTPNRGLLFNDNVELSFLRAKSVAHALINLGIPHDRIAVRGFGETRPVVPNDTPEHRAQNRRVEVRIRAVGLNGSRQAEAPGNATSSAASSGQTSSIQR